MFDSKSQVRGQVNSDNVFGNVKTIMEMGAWASRVELLDFESGIKSSKVTYGNPRTNSVVYQDVQRRSIVIKEVFENLVVVEFEYVDDIKVFHDGQWLRLSFFDIPGRIVVSRSGYTDTSYTFVGETLSRLYSYESDSGGKLKVSANFFDRVPGN